MTREQNQKSSRTYAVPDLHGRLDILEAALERIEANPTGGTVVFLGDYVDRGPQSRQIIERLMAGPTKPGWRWVCLKGNHEDMMLGAIKGDYDPAWWIGNGGGATLASYGGDVPEEHLAWLRALPLMYLDGHRIFVHAGVDETIGIEDQTEQTLLWSRLPQKQDTGHRVGYVVHGHTPFRDGPVVLQNRANLDTLAWFDGRLCIAVFDDDVAGGPGKILTVKRPSYDDLEAA